MVEVGAEVVVVGPEKVGIAVPENVGVVVPEKVGIAPWVGVVSEDAYPT